EARRQKSSNQSDEADETGADKKELEQGIGRLRLDSDYWISTLLKQVNAAAHLPLAVEEAVSQLHESNPEYLKTAFSDLAITELCSDEPQHLEFALHCCARVIKTLVRARVSDRGLNNLFHRVKGEYLSQHKLG